MLKHLKLKTEKYKNHKFMPFCINDDMLLVKYKTIWAKIEDLKNIKLNASSVYEDRYIKIKIKMYGDKFYTNFRGLNVPEDDPDFEYFTIASIIFLLFYENKHYLQVM